MHGGRKHPHRARLAAVLLAGWGLGLLLAGGTAHAQDRGGAVIHVDADATTGGDGASWATAFQDLQDALAVAVSGDEVWIAEGVYRPTSGSDRTATFALASGVALYGGFDGTETTLEERDWTANRSTLSGDVGAQGDSTDNAYHVVTANGVGSTAVLDGLTVQHGQANVALAERDRGGGLYAPQGSPTIRNAHFRWNRAAVGGGLQRGGGVYVEGGSPTVEDCLFEGNVGGGAGFGASGGAPVLRRVVFRGNGGTGAVMFADGSAGLVEDALVEHHRGQGAAIFASSPVFRRATFRDNVTTPFGTTGPGAFIPEGGAPLFEDCLFERLRTSDDLGLGEGAVYADGGTLPVAPAFVRTTFRDNAANAGGGAYVRAGTATFLFCRFERNRARAGGGLNAFNAAVTVVGGVFVGNLSDGSGGGALRFAYPSPDGATSLVASTLFAGNTARANGGAVYAGATASSPIRFVGVTFTGNEAHENGGAVYVHDSGGIRIEGAVLWGDTAPVGPEVFRESGGPPTLVRSILAGGCPAGAPCTDVLDEDPLFLREPSPGPDGTWGTADDDYGSLRPHPSSPAVDGGLTALLPADVWDLDADGDTAEPLPIDAVGGRRVWGAEVDLGAYERGPAARSPWRAPPGQASAEEAGVVVEVKPNPVRDSGTVVLTLGEASEVEVSVYDVLGRRVAVLHAGPLAEGRHEVALEAGRLPAGVYVVRAAAGGAVRSVRVTVGR